MSEPTIKPSRLSAYTEWQRREGVPFSDLARLVRPKLAGTAFDLGGSVPWYCVTVKLDLEARGRIERVPGARPQRVRRAR